MSRHPAGGQGGRGGGQSCGHRGTGSRAARLTCPVPDSPSPAGPQDGNRTPRPGGARGLLRWRGAQARHLPAGRGRAPAARTHAERGGTQAPPPAPASGWRRGAGKGRGPPLPAAGKENESVGKVQEVGKGTGSGALSLPRSKENKVTGYISRVQRREGLRPFPRDPGIPRGQGKDGEAGRKTSPGETRRKKGQKIGKKELTPTKAES